MISAIRPYRPSLRARRKRLANRGAVSTCAYLVDKGASSSASCGRLCSRLSAQIFARTSDMSEIVAGDGEQVVPRRARGLRHRGGGPGDAVPQAGGMSATTRAAAAFNRTISR